MSQDDKYEREYKNTVKQVLLELLRENHPQVRTMLRAAIREWLEDKLRVTTALTIRAFAVLFVAGVAYVLFARR